MGKYLLVPLCICLFGIFIYPTLYKYDKLDQKYPVQINRITGETKVLTGQGWQSADDYNRAAETMSNYKEEIISEIENQSELIKEDVLQTIQDELDMIVEKQASIDTRPGNEKDYEDLELIDEESDDDTEISTSFSKGDTMEKVEIIMGTPDRINHAGDYETWWYKFSSVSFKNGVVTGWSNNSNSKL